MQLHIQILHCCTSITYLWYRYSKLGIFYFSFFCCFLGGGRESRRKPEQGKMWFSQGPIFHSKKPFKHCRVKHILCISRQSQPKKRKNKASLSPLPRSQNGTQAEINQWLNMLCNKVYLQNQTKLVLVYLGKNTGASHWVTASLPHQKPRTGGQCLQFCGVWSQKDRASTCHR